MASVRPSGQCQGSPVTVFRVMASTGLGARKAPENSKHCNPHRCGLMDLWKTALPSPPLWLWAISLPP